MKKLIAILFFSVVAFAAEARVKLPSVFADGMVFQQKTDAAVWGKADAGKTVSVEAGWTDRKFTARAGKDGRWLVRIPTPSAGGPYTVKISDGETLELSDVLVGEVWFASGQSNMELRVRGSGGQPVEGAADLILRAKPSVPIRMYRSMATSASEPADDVRGAWYRNDSEGVSQCSAVAYFFAKELYECLDVPIGIVEADWGGSNIQAWMRRDLLEKEFPEVSFASFAEDVKSDNPRVRRKVPSAIYNGQLHPLIPFTVKGFLWYQGESNRPTPGLYTRLQTAFAAMLRSEFQLKDAPFYFVQIAPYKYDGASKFASGYFCEAQEKTLGLIPNSGMVTTLDIGEQSLIHPRRKAQVGKRLAWYALTRDYGFKGITPEPPTVSSVSFENGKALVKVKSDKNGVNPSGPTLSGFELAGSDRVFHKAMAKVTDKGRAISVWSKEVPEPVAVRYCFRNWGVASVFSQWGVPMGPFRSDNWDDIVE